MLGCLRRVGCLVVLLLVAGGAYYWWMVRVNTSAPVASSAGVWHAVRPGDAATAEQSVQSLRAAQGKVFANLTPAQAVAYLLQQTANQLPASSTGIDAMVSGEQLHVRSVVSVAQLGGSQVLGPLASMLGSRDTVELAGKVDLVRPGLAQLHVTKIQLHTLNLPSPMIPKLVHQIRKDSPDGLADDALALPLPPYIGDIRIANGKVTLYKNVQ